MIFVTVGTQLPFDRLVQAMDAWAEQHSRRDVFAQVGAEGFRPRHLSCAATLTPAEFQEKIQGCAVLVGHAGMGTLLTALENAKPLVILARRASLGEHRNDHQLATAKRFGHLPGVWTPASEKMLPEALAAAESAPPQKARDLLDSAATLSGAIQRFLLGTNPKNQPMH